MSLRLESLVAGRVVTACVGTLSVLGPTALGTCRSLAVHFRERVTGSLKLGVCSIVAVFTGLICLVACSFTIRCKTLVIYGYVCSQLKSRNLAKSLCCKDVCKELIARGTLIVLIVTCYCTGGLNSCNLNYGVCYRSDL